VVADQAIGAAQVGIAESDRPNERGFIGASSEVDLGFAVAEHVYMRWFVIVEIDDDPQTAAAQHCYHAIE
jgi:hypothetical protein